MDMNAKLLLRLLRDKLPIHSPVKYIIDDYVKKKEEETKSKEKKSPNK